MTIHSRNIALDAELLLIARAAIELRHFGGHIGLQLIDQLATTDESEQTQALDHLIEQIKAREVILEAQDGRSK